MMIYTVISYIKFLIKSTNRHGVHSPFVYNFISIGLNAKRKYLNKTFQDFIYFKEQLIDDKSEIIITDYGSGSKHFKGNIRQISDIAKYAGISDKKAKLLIRITAYFKPKIILEIGTSLGLSTSILAKNSQAKVTTIEGCPNTSETAKKYLKNLNYTNIEFITNKFDDVLPMITQNNTFDLIYFDGNHQKEATLNYFNQCLKTTHNKSLFIFDDIYLNANMQEAWRKIITHPKVSVSIDLFHYGLVFFRTEQPKQHFYLRTNS
ncbi:MAG: class I SAM-dependent methyltransferase [Flavobacteriaceae bacterium]|nr:class I SAM-dependent methyltransferase [Flavobacteriaceae bacterium]